VLLTLQYTHSVVDEGESSIGLIPNLCDQEYSDHNGIMARTGLQISVAAMLGLVACAAVNVWLFRVGFLYGLVGLNITKHVGVAVLCQAMGVNRRDARVHPPSAPPQTARCGEGMAFPLVTTSDR
jgi:hypothetical protein